LKRRHATHQTNFRNMAGKTDSQGTTYKYHTFLESLGTTLSGAKRNQVYISPVAREQVV
jgi:hypothetical protein